MNSNHFSKEKAARIETKTKFINEHAEIVSGWVVISVELDGTKK